MLTEFSKNPTITELIGLSKFYDKDKRFMALRDLTANVIRSEDLLSPPTIWSQIAEVFLTQLQDSSSEVQANAVECVGEIFYRFPANWATYMVQELLHNIRQQTDFKEIYFNCLRNILIQAKPEKEVVFCSGLIESLIASLEALLKGNDNDKSDLCAMYCELLGIMISKSHNENCWTPAIFNMMTLLFTVLEAPKFSSQCRRKVASCLCLIIPKLSLDLLDLFGHKTREHICKLFHDVKDRKANELSLDLLPYLQCATEIVSRSKLETASSVTSLLPTLLELVSFSMNASLDNLEVSSVNCDVAESSLFLLGRVVDNLPFLVKPFFHELITLVKSGVQFNPNQLGEEVMKFEEDFALDNEYDIDTFDDGDSLTDSSSKIRKASIKLIVTLMASEELSLLMGGDLCSVESLLPVLLHQLSESESIVREAIYESLSKVVCEICLVDSCSDDNNSDDVAQNLIKAALPIVTKNILNEMDAVCVPRASYALQKSHEAGLNFLNCTVTNTNYSFESESCLIFHQTIKVLKSTKYPMNATVPLLKFIDRMATKYPKSVSEVLCRASHFSLMPLLLCSQSGLAESSKVGVQTLFTLKSLLTSLGTVDELQLTSEQKAAMSFLMSTLGHNIRTSVAQTESEGPLLASFVAIVELHVQKIKEWDSSIETLLQRFLDRFLNELPPQCRRLIEKSSIPVVAFSRRGIDTLRAILHIAVESIPMQQFFLKSENCNSQMHSLLSFFQNQIDFNFENKNLAQSFLMCLLSLSDLYRPPQDDFENQPFITAKCVLKIAESKDSKLVSMLLSLVSKLLRRQSVSKDIFKHIYSNIVLKILSRSIKCTEAVGQSLIEFYNASIESDLQTPEQQLFNDLNTALEADDTTKTSGITAPFVLDSLGHTICQCQAIVILKSKNTDFKNDAIDGIKKALYHQDIPSTKVFALIRELGLFDDSLINRLFQLLEINAIMSQTAQTLAKFIEISPEILISEITILERYNAKQNGLGILECLSISLLGNKTVLTPSTAKHIYNFLLFTTQQNPAHIHEVSLCLQRLSQMNPVLLSSLFIETLRLINVDHHCIFIQSILKSLELNLNSVMTGFDFHQFFPLILNRLQFENIQGRMSIYSYLSKAVLLKHQMSDAEIEAALLERPLESDLHIRSELIKEIDLGPFKNKKDEGLPLRLKCFHLILNISQRIKNAQMEANQKKKLIQSFCHRQQRDNERQKRQLFKQKLIQLAKIGEADSSEIQSISFECIQNAS